MSSPQGRIVCLTGGVGGAKLALGLQQSVPASDLTIIVNTGDDFHHLGLSISPDIDTLLYTLSGRANTQLGWGREGESWGFMDALRELGGPDWFQLGDRDVALHVLRTAALNSGEQLSSITARFASHFAVRGTILPMSNQPVRTMVETKDGSLAFQRYFVELRCAPVATKIRFEGAKNALAAPGVVEAIEQASIILIAPSNPYLSIDPILAVPPIRSSLEKRRGTVVAISPLVGGKAVKGPTAKLMAELGIAVENESIARHYSGLIDGLLIDSGDVCEAKGISVARAPTLMTTLDEKISVASAAFSLAQACRR